MYVCLCAWRRIINIWRGIQSATFDIVATYDEGGLLFLVENLSHIGVYPFDTLEIVPPALLWIYRCMWPMHFPRTIFICVCVMRHFVQETGNTTMWKL